MFNRVSVYVVAHQDDWQLFMDPDISTDILDPACRTVVIHTTAGDAGEDQKFWRVREKGAINSLLFRISNDLKAGVTKKNISIGYRKISVAGVANCSFYFLRLPDGGMHGDGFRLYGWQSLSKIRLKCIDKITTVDQVNTFHSFGEISTLINDILRRELRITRVRDAGKMTLHFPEYDDALTPNDHNDHFNTALLLQHMPLYGSMKKYAFVHYDIQHSAADLDGMNLFWKIGMFCVYHQTVMDLYGYSTLNESPSYNVWCTKKTVCREIA